MLKLHGRQAVEKKLINLQLQDLSLDMTRFALHGMRYSVFAAYELDAMPVNSLEPLPAPETKGLKGLEKQDDL